MISLHYLLPEAVVANSELIGKPRRGSPDPTSADNLRSGPRLGKDQRIEHGHIFFRLQAVPEEVSCDQITLLGQVIIQLENTVVLTIVIVQIHIQRSIRARIERQQLSQLAADRAAVCVCSTQGKRIREAVIGIVDRRRNRSIRLERVAYDITHTLVVAEDE